MEDYFKQVIKDRIDQKLERDKMMAILRYLDNAIPEYKLTAEDTKILNEIIAKKVNKNK